MRFNFLSSPFFILFLLVSLAPDMLAQRQREQGRLKEKLRANYTAFITQRLNLTETEAQKFWPVYNAYRQDLDLLKDQKETRPATTLTDKEAEDMLVRMVDNRSKEVELQKTCIQKLKAIMPVQKIVLLWQAEREFREKIVSNIKKRRMDSGNDD